MEINNNNPRGWERKQDVDEILTVIASRFLKPALEENSKSLFIWYMIKKGKIKDASKYNVHPEIKATLDKMDSMVETIKAFSNLDMSSGDKKHSHIINIASIIRDDFLNISLRFMDNPNIFIGFMYGYYFKAGIITAMDAISLESGLGHVGGAASCGIATAAILKDIDSNTCLDRNNYKIIYQKPSEPVKVEEKASENKVEKMDYSYSTNNITKINKKSSDSKDQEYKDRFITIRGGTGRRVNKPDVELDMLEIYNYYKEGFSSKDIAELYGASTYTIRDKISEFCKKNNLEPVLKNSGGNKYSAAKKSKTIKHEPKKSEDEIMFEKATLANTKTIDKLKNKTFPSIAVAEDTKKFQNFPVVFSSKSKDKKLVVSSKLKSIIDKEGPGFYKLNDGMYYYITSGDYLIFRNEPTLETLEKYRSIKSS